MGSKVELIKTNLWEIKKSGSLKTLGGLLALGHFLQFCLWTMDGRLPLKLAQQGLPMCWSFMEDCSWLHLPLGLLTIVYFAYAVFAGLAALILILTDWVAVGYYLLLFSLMCGLALYIQDLRLSTNEGYFILFVTFAYLFVPSKHSLMRRLLISFFAARGLSQVAADWLTGNWYMDHLKVPVKLAEWLAAVGVLAQMIGAVALLFRDARYFWSGWIGLFVYQCMHLYIGEVLGASFALGALVYIALDELELRKAEREYIYQSFIRPEPSFLWGGLLLCFFWAAQLTPFFSLPQDSVVKNILQVWTLHPDAAHEECQQKTYAQYKGRIEEIEVVPQLTRQPAMYCNPYLRYLDLKALCQQHKAQAADFVTISSVFDVHNIRDKTMVRAFEVKDFCAPELTFKRTDKVQWTTNPAE